MIKSIAGLKLESQARLVLIVCLAQIVMFELMAGFLPIPVKDRVVIFFMILISLGISTFYLTYSINCMVAGDCNMFAWVIAGFVIFAAVFAMLSATLTVTTSRAGFKALLDSPHMKPYYEAVIQAQAEEQQQQQQRR